MDSLKKPPANRKSLAAPPLAPNFRPPARSRSKKILWSFFFFLFFSFLGAASFLFYRAFTTGQAITLENAAERSLVSGLKSFSRSLLSAHPAPLKGEAEGRINILLLGRAGERYPGKNLTDTVMIASLNTETKKVALLSLPRDLYAPIPDTGYFTKVNSLYQYGLNQNEGVEPLRQSVEVMTGLPIHYFAMIDFDGFERVVDTLGGVRVEVMRDIYDTRYPGKNYSYETFELKKGWQTLDGQTALKYVRERHDDPEGDFGRAKRQQQVMQALRDQAFSLATFLNIFTIDALLTTLGESVKTDLALAELESLITLARTLDTQNIETLVIDAWKKESLLRTSHVMVGPTRAFILVPRAGPENWSEIQDVAENIFALEALEARKTKIAQEAARVVVLVDQRELATSERFRVALREYLPLENIRLLPVSLEKLPEKSILVDTTNLAKPFTVDELLKRFPLRKQETLGLASLPRMADEADILILVGSDLKEVLELENNTGSVEPTLDAEPLPPQPRR